MDEANVLWRTPGGQVNKPGNSRFNSHCNKRANTIY
uniref:Uncharacterized protein n=1 Tax=Molossus molossus TaxID=27622 RepID=A0A7J8ENU9_MOLMO|nr:hypothetical protein HJG59_001666 [Molossus molossus]